MSDKKKIKCVNCGKTLAQIDEQEPIPPTLEIKCSKCKTINKGRFYDKK